MEAHGLLRPFGFLRKKLYVVVMKHGHIDMIAHDFRCAPPICMSQHQDRGRNTGAAQLDGFVQTGHGQLVRAVLQKHAGHRHGAASVRVGFDDGHNQRMGADKTPNMLHIIRRRIQIDLRPHRTPRK